jgi:hypothetical protein
MSVVIQTAAAETATGNLDVKATLNEPLTVSCGSSLNFGTITVAANTAVTYTLGPDGTESIDTGSIVTANPGACTFSGSNGSGTATITEVNSNALSGSSDTVDIQVGTSGPTVTVDEFVADTPTITNGGGTINIGATLNIGTDIDSGDFGEFSDTITVTVDDSGT